MRLIALSSGTYYHIESLEAPRYAAYFDQVLTPERLDEVRAENACIFVPCRSPAQRLIAQADQIGQYLAAGGTVVAMGESRSDLWLPGVTFHGRPTNWWWWLEPGADLGNRVTAPGHPLMAGIGKDDITWHLHGHFDTPEGADVLAEDAEGRTLFYIDEVSTPGRMIVTSLDPIYHHGSHFMPATTRFLDRFLPNLRAYLDG
ncbi:MAG: hypothetical protein NXH88_01105 [Hyphomonas sp.]|nr:hypothetical protein [Hyphomonas sp.]